MATQIKRYETALSKKPEDKAMHLMLLHSYNYLRELNNESLVFSVNEIDNKWLTKIQVQAMFQALFPQTSTRRSEQQANEKKFPEFDFWWPSAK